jgi:purine catabolism regulator
VLPTVREVLRLEPVARALPEVLTGRERLDAPVRWVHVAETAEAARLGSGGELLLATGVGWPSDDASLRRLGRVLIEADVAGLVLELGAPMPVPPPALVDEFRTAGLPFAVLHREARFVAITEAVHSRIIAEQMGALRARDDIHALFTDLSLRGSPADFIVDQAARVLGCPVVLEDTNHRVIAAGGVDAASRPGGGPELADWEQRSRAEHRSAASGWTIVPVEARGMRWGHLIALPGEPHPAGRSNVLEQAAVALALSRLTDRDDDEWTRRSHDALLAALLGRRFAGEGGVTARFEAAGFPLGGRASTRSRRGIRSSRGRSWWRCRRARAGRWATPCSPRSRRRRPRRGRTTRRRWSRSGRTRAGSPACCRRWRRRSRWWRARRPVARRGASAARSWCSGCRTGRCCGS